MMKCFVTTKTKKKIYFFTFHSQKVIRTLYTCKSLKLLHSSLIVCFLSGLIPSYALLHLLVKTSTIDTESKNGLNNILLNRPFSKSNVIRCNSRQTLTQTHFSTGVIHDVFYQQITNVLFLLPTKCEDYRIYPIFFNSKLGQYILYLVSCS